jgi:hypothetical protein
MQETRALEADIDECGLHARQHAHHAPEVDVADQPLVAAALDVDFLQHAALDERDAGLHRGGIDQYLVTHGAADPRCQPSMPESCSKRAVSKRGKPTTPE